MLGVSFTTWIIFMLGIFLGYILGNSEFRKRFFRGVKSFLSQNRKNVEELNKQYKANGLGKKKKRKIYYHDSDDEAN